MNVLLTGGRAPATLELARLLHRAGHTIDVAESAPIHLCSRSRAVRRNVAVAAPACEPLKFASDVATACVDGTIQLLIPTCEETFYVAALAGRIRHLVAEAGRQAPAILCDDLATLRSLHHKFEFTQVAAAAGLAIPQTWLLTGVDELQTFGEQSVVFKPVWSRFATQVHLPPHTARALAALHPTPAAPWVAQTFLSGRSLCSYSIAGHGRLLAHACYPVNFRAGNGAAIDFTGEDNASVLAWVSRFVAHTGFHGQIAFDFIQPPGAPLMAIECNPRTTSGLHLLAAAPGFAPLLAALAGDGELPGGLIIPPHGERAALRSALLLYGPGQVRSAADLNRWWTALRSRDVLTAPGDWGPLGAQPAIIRLYQKWSSQHDIDLITATTVDIAWNGEELP